jgi:pimeloyl-ACP methyl ester carboxylesterase
MLLAGGAAPTSSRLIGRRSVTVWQGEQDTLVPMSHARRLEAAVPNGTLRVISATGHYLPAVVADAVLEDLAP